MNYYDVCPKKLNFHFILIFCLVTISTSEDACSRHLVTSGEKRGAEVCSRLGHAKDVFRGNATL